MGFFFGISLFALSSFCLIAISSFTIHGGADQSAVQESALSEILLGRTDVKNVCGIRGAYIAEGLVNTLYGFASLFILFYSFSLSFRFMGITKNISIVKRLIFSTALLIWSSIFLASLSRLIQPDSFMLWGGQHGELWVETLIRNIGTAGLIILLILTAVIIVVAVSSESIGFFRKLISFSWLPAIKLPSRSKRVKEDRQNDASPISEGATNYSNDDTIEPSNLIVSDSPVIEKDLEPKKQEATNETNTNTGISQLGNMQVERAKEEEKADPSLLSSERTDPRMDLANFRFPTIDMLTPYDRQQAPIDMREIEDNQQRIIATLDSFKIRVTPVKATVGPTVTLYEVAPDAGIKISRIRNLEDDIAMSLKAVGGIRIIAPMPGKGTIGIEVPNKKPQTVSMHSVLSSKKYQESDMELPVAIGKTITNEVYLFDLTRMPHLLIAGATGQGKSVGLNAMITSLLYSKHPAELKFVLVDPKMLEFSVYEAMEKHYLAKLPDHDKAIVTDMSKVVPTLNSLCIEMDNRYQLLTDAKVRNIKEYNQLYINKKLKKSDGHKYLPYIVLVVDEFADLIMTSGKEVERPITRIAQKARAAGIHMVIATQRPSTDVITGIIKANFPARMAFKVFSMVDSRTILDQPGANHLVGRGDMLIYQGKDLIRLQCAFLDTPESEAIVRHIANQASYDSAYVLPEYIDESSEGAGKSFDPLEKDPLFEEVARMVVNSQQGSTSNIQRKFNIGYNRAGRLMDQLEASGIVGPQDGSKPRQVLIQDDMSLDRILDAIG